MTATLEERVAALEATKADLLKKLAAAQALATENSAKLAALEKQIGGGAAEVAAPAKAEEKEEEDDELDLFGEDDEPDEEAEKIKAERIAAYQKKKDAKAAKGDVVIAKSSILLDVKPWDDETDMVKLEEAVRSIQADGLLWGASKLVAVGYGIKKLQISCVVEDDKVGTDFLEENITGFEDFVQSVDIAAFNKI